jgi:hypothetical protein
LLGFLKIFAANSGSMSLIYLARRFPASIISGWLRISSALGLVSGFLSSSFSSKFLIREGTVEGIWIGNGSVISAIYYIGCFLVVNSNRIIPKAHMSTFAVADFSFL